MVLGPTGRRPLMVGSVLAALPSLIAVACEFSTQLGTVRENRLEPESKLS